MAVIDYLIEQTGMTLKESLKDNKIDKGEEAKIKHGFELYRRGIDKGNIKAKMGKVKSGLGEVKSKIEPSMFSEVIGLYNMVKSYIDGEYREVPWETILTLVAVLIYVVSPVDIIPDAIPVAGWLDDGWVMTRLLPALSKDIQKYKEWKENGGESEEQDQDDDGWDNDDDDGVGINIDGM